MTDTRQGPPRQGPPHPAPPGEAPDSTTIGPVLPMDPRIRRRRIEVQRDQGRRRLRILLGCLSVAAVVAGAVGATRSPLLDVDHVEVRGTEHTTRGQVVAATGLAGKPAMIDLDAAAIARRVEALPWVRRATATKEWPATVRVDVVERRPAAVVPAGDGIWALADATGRVLQVGPEKPPGLPVLGNVPLPGRPGTALGRAARLSLRVAAALDPDLRSRVADVAAVSGGEVELQLVPPGAVVRLGPPVDLDRKLTVLATVVARADLGGVTVIDVRVPRAPSLTRK